MTKAATKQATKTTPAPPAPVTIGCVCAAPRPGIALYLPGPDEPMDSLDRILSLTAHMYAAYGLECAGDDVEAAAELIRADVGYVRRIAECVPTRITPPDVRKPATKARAAKPKGKAGRRRKA